MYCRMCVAVCSRNRAIACSVFPPRVSPSVVCAELASSWCCARYHQTLCPILHSSSSWLQWCSYHPSPLPSRGIRLAARSSRNRLTVRLVSLHYIRFPIPSVDPVGGVPNHHLRVEHLPALGKHSARKANSILHSHPHHSWEWRRRSRTPSSLATR